MDEGRNVSRHGLRLQPAAESWSETNGLPEDVVPGGGSSIPVTGASSVALSSKARGMRWEARLSTGTKWSTGWSTAAVSASQSPFRPLGENYAHCGRGPLRSSVWPAEPPGRLTLGIQEDHPREGVRNQGCDL